MIRVETGAPLIGAIGAIGTDPATRPGALAGRDALQRIASAAAEPPKPGLREPGLDDFVISPSRIVELDRRDVPAVSAPPARALQPADFAPPSPDGGELELDPAWLAERAAKLVPKPAPKRPRTWLTWATLLAVVAVAAVAVAVVVIWRHQRAAREAALLPGVALRIIAEQPVAITIDGRAAGTTPALLNRPKGTTPIIIAAPALGKMKQVVPDRDQTVNLSAP